MALRSHNNAERATIQGVFKDEIIPVSVPVKGKGSKGERVFDTDEHFRPGLTPDDLAKLPPAFLSADMGTVTAGNSSGINDGAAAMVIMSNSKCRELGLTPICRIRATGKGGLSSGHNGPVAGTGSKQSVKKEWYDSGGL